MLEKLKLIGEIVGFLSGTFTFLILVVTPIREKILGLSKIKEGVKCQLRQQMLSTYYRNKSSDKIRQYEYENFLYSYAAYKELNGNSFIDKIKNEVDDWEVIS